MNCGRTLAKVLYGNGYEIGWKRWLEIETGRVEKVEFIEWVRMRKARFKM